MNKGLESPEMSASGQYYLRAGTSQGLLSSLLQIEINDKTMILLIEGVASLVQCKYCPSYQFAKSRVEQ